MPSLIAAALFGVLAASTPATITAVNPPLEESLVVSSTPPEVTEAPQTLAEMIDKVSVEIGISSSTLTNLVWSESRNKADAVGDKGESLGLVQINLAVTNAERERKGLTRITREEAFDAEFALRYAANEIKEGRESAWSVCNCYALVSTKVKLPRMAQITPNSSGKVGNVAIFYYGKVKHIAYVIKTDTEGFTVQEANKTHCLTGTRFVKWGDPSLTGFYDPN